MSNALHPAGKTAGQRNPQWRANTSPTAAHYWQRKRREVARLLSRNVSLPSAAQIVDFGAGAGGDVLLLASLFPDARILAIDADPVAIDRLNARFSEFPTVRVECANLLERLPIEDETVDLGHCSEVLEHIPNPDVVLAEAHRVIKPGGHFVITTPNEPNLLQKGFWLRRRQRHAPAAAPGDSPDGPPQDVELHGHISLATIKEWERAFARAGFEQVAVGRGALMYGGRPLLDRAGVLAAYFAAEALIDLPPRRLTRRISDNLISLYRRV
jgi:SAM-dependent methyltransferase